MADHAEHHRPLDASPLFADGRAARRCRTASSPAASWRDDPLLDAGRSGADYADTFPFEVTDDVLARGRQRFDIYCAVCHDLRRHRQRPGRAARLLKPPNLHTDLSRGYRLRGVDQPLKTAAGRLHLRRDHAGYGAMPDYATQVRCVTLGHRRPRPRAAAQPGRQARQLTPAEREAHFGKGGEP